MCLIARVATASALSASASSDALTAGRPAATIDPVDLSVIERDRSRAHTRHHC